MRVDHPVRHAEPLRTRERVEARHFLCHHPAPHTSRLIGAEVSARLLRYFERRCLADNQVSRWSPLLAAGLFRGQRQRDVT